MQQTFRGPNDAATFSGVGSSTPSKSTKTDAALSHGKGTYLVQLIERLMGEPGDQLIVSLADMRSWTFYASAEDMSFAYEHRGLASRSDRHADHEAIA